MVFHFSDRIYYACINQFYLHKDGAEMLNWCHVVYTYTYLYKCTYVYTHKQEKCRYTFFTIVKVIIKVIMGMFARCTQYVLQLQVYLSPSLTGERREKILESTRTDYASSSKLKHEPTWTYNWLGLNPN